MPRERATSISGLVSAEKVTSPSTSAGAMPASSRAAATASTARRSSLRPDSFENSVAPMPADRRWCRRSCGAGVRRRSSSRLTGARTARQSSTDGAGHVVAEAVGAADRHRHLAPAVVALGRGGGTRHRAREHHRVAGVVRCAEADRHCVDDGAPGPAQSVTNRPTNPFVVRMFMKMSGDPRSTASSGVVVDVLVVARRDGGGHDEGAGERDLELGKRRRRRRPRRTRSVSDAHRCSRRRHLRLGPASGPASPPWTPSRASSALGPCRASARSACPTGSSGGSGTRRRRPCPRGGAGWRAPRAGPPPTPTTWRRRPPRRPAARCRAATPPATRVTRMASVSM